MILFPFLPFVDTNFFLSSPTHPSSSFRLYVPDHHERNQQSSVMQETSEPSVKTLLRLHKVED